MVGATVLHVALFAGPQETLLDDVTVPQVDKDHVAEVVRQGLSHRVCRGRYFFF